MKTNTADLARLAETVEALRQEVARLGERVAALENARDVLLHELLGAVRRGTEEVIRDVSIRTRAEFEADRERLRCDIKKAEDEAIRKVFAQAAALATSLAPAQPAAPEAEGLSEELVLVISAAVAAFLGKKAHIRQIRLLGSAAWAQQGRATIQASHALSHA
jgi:methylmalonyl-CoA carboxyltransferase large subunit